MTRLMTALQVAEQFGLPSPNMVRTMRAKGLKHVPLGKAILYDEADVAAFIEASKVEICQDQTPAPDSNGLKNGKPGTSSGTKSDAKGSKQQAQQISDALKKLSKTTSPPVEPQNDQQGRVVQGSFPSRTR